MNSSFGDRQMNKHIIILQCDNLKLEVHQSLCRGEEGVTYCLVRLGKASPLKDQGRICSPEAMGKLY